MSYAIWKYLIEPGDKFGIEMPDHAVLLDVQILDGQPHLYAAVEPNQTKVLRRFRLVPTGIPFEDGPVWARGEHPGEGLVHVATFQITHEGNRPLVFHLFEDRNRGN